MTKPRPVVTLSPDGAMVTHTHVGPKPRWSNTFPVEALDAWIKFYTRLRDRRGGLYAKFYTDDVKALEAVKARIKAGAVE